MPFVLSRTARSAVLGAPRQAALHRSCGNDPRGRRTAVAPHGCGQGIDGSGRPAAARYPAQGEWRVSRPFARTSISPA